MLKKIPPRAKREAILFMATEPEKAWTAREIWFCMQHHGAKVLSTSVYAILDGWAEKRFVKKVSIGGMAHYGRPLVGYRITKRGLALARRLAS